MSFLQVYDPFGNILLSTLVAALPLVILLGGMLIFKLKSAVAAGLGLAAALVIAMVVYGMPASLAFTSAGYGAAYGFLPIGWIILNILFLFRLVEGKGLFTVLQTSLGRITTDQRLQVLLVTMCLGSFFEGASGFGTPVAVTTVILIGLGFPCMMAAVLSLIANSVCVVFGSIGTGMIALQGVSGIDLLDISHEAGLQLIPLSLILAIWLIWTFSGFRRMLAVWPAILVTGLSYTITQTAFALWHGPWLATLLAAAVTFLCLILLLRFWKPREPYQPYAPTTTSAANATISRKELRCAWLPWIILSAVVITWSIPAVKDLLDKASYLFTIPNLDGAVIRMPPISTASQPMAAVFSFNWLSSIGTGVFFSAILSGLLLGYKPVEMLRAYGATLGRSSTSLLTICLLVALGFITRYSGLDATLGLAFAHTGMLYPFFGALLGWLGVLSTGSITSSNVLFGNLQVISSSSIGIDPAVMVAANPSGGLAGKLISPQSITITATAADQKGSEHAILRAVMPHSLAMVIFMGLVILLRVYLF
ncbi:MAG: L-lactate permease [Anaerolineaceae bacterium]|nr:L-lactate permease [Anaerolineaceae bacterium]